MSGHSHWAGIKHKKGIQDAKRAKIFTKLAKPIVIAAREGGGNPATNFKLRLAIDKAQEFNMPKANIERAVARGTGKLKDSEIFEVIYEAMGPGGIMMLIFATTDNKNRTVSEIKSVLTKAGGKLGEAGSVMWNFEQIGSMALDLNGKNPDELELIAIDAGAKDIKIGDGQLTLFCEVKNLQIIKNSLEKKGLLASAFSIIYLPKNTLTIDENTRIDYEKLLETFDEQEDVSEIYDNL
jgi:YebC/PmpR family DNA-binding regulatory protein